MNIKRLPIVFLAGGLASKALLVLLWKLWQLPGLFGMLISYDPVAFIFAERVAGVFFDQRRFFPTPGEASLFEVLLVIGFGIECLLVGFMLQWLLRRYKGSRRSEEVTTMLPRAEPPAELK